MARFTSYSSKAKPTDSDTLLINDASSSSNKQVSFTAVLGWVKDKLGSSTIDGLNTTSKNVVGAINELHDAVEEGGSASEIEQIRSDVDDLKADLDDVNERIDGLGDGVPTTVRQAMLALFQSAAYAETGLTDEIAVIESWSTVVTAISLNQSSISISGASTSQLVATTTPAGGTVIWASSDTSVATVSSNGLVTGVGNGSCTITASCGGKNATCSVTVSGFATLTSISAVYTQSGTVYNTDTLDSLKDDLVVTAHYGDTTTATVPSADYTLSGTLEVGTSTIVVSYGGKTATFNVTVTQHEVWDYEWYSTSGTVPPNMVVAQTPTFAPNNEYMEVKVTNGTALDFNHVGAARIVAELATVSGAYNNNPQFVINTATKAGAKWFINSDSNISANCSGTNAEVYTPTVGDFHEYDLRCDVGDCKLYIDGVLEDSGTGRTNDQYITYTGIVGSFNANFIRLKSLKYKVL